MRRTIARPLALSLVVAGGALAQNAPPGTDVFLVRLRAGADVAISDPPVNLTKRPGYDNQPAFTLDGRAILYTSIREDAQADIYRVALDTRQITRLTSTPESEYSPTPLPDASGFSVVRVEKDSTQRLWAFGYGARVPSLVFSNIAPVGYHAWLDDHDVALFILGSPNTLEIADTHTGDFHVVAHDVGRSVQRVTGTDRVSYLARADSAWYLETADPAARAGSGDAGVRVAKMPAGADFVVWASPTIVITAAGTTIYRLDTSAGRTAPWKPIADFKEEGVNNISRLALSGDGNWLAFVAEPVAR